MEEITEKDLLKLNSSKGIHSMLQSEEINLKKTIRYVDYTRQLKQLQAELIRQQACIIEKGQRVIVIFEGRDAAGKGGAIRRITERINPRHFRIVALPIPTTEERSQWYFQRYIRQFPKSGEIVFFDRSWYNRAVVEPVNGFCSDEEYRVFMNQVNEFERMITESGIILVKIYMSISKKEQKIRFEEIRNNPLKHWKMSAVDERAQELWDVYTLYKKRMFENTRESGIPFKVIKANRKIDARLNAIKHMLKAIPYDKSREI